MKFVENMCIAYVQNSTIFNYNIEEIFNSVSIFIIPMVNPDGVDLVNGFLVENSTEYVKSKSIASKFPSIPFPSGWKSNIDGVDLNLQFPAGWLNARQIKYSQGFTRSGPKRFCRLWSFNCS